MRKRVECECGWSTEGSDEEIVRVVGEHCVEAHDGRVPRLDQILASARPIDPGAAEQRSASPSREEQL